MVSLPDFDVYIAVGPTDMRKSVNGLSILVQENLKKNLFTGSMFCFCNRNRNIIKILFWDKNGFVIWYKKLDKDKFKWPDSEEDLIQTGRRELQWLLEGLTIDQKNAFERLEYELVI
jgi:transposase